MRLLLIEDDTALAFVMREGLEKCGFSVDVAGGGLDGEEKAAVNQYDVILLDLNLPDKDRLEVLAAIRKKGNETPNIVITARGDVSQRALGLNQGADDYLTKPFGWYQGEDVICFDEYRSQLRIGDMLNYLDRYPPSFPPDTSINRRATPKSISYPMNRCGRSTSTYRKNSLQHGRHSCGGLTSCMSIPIRARWNMTLLGT